MVRLIWLVCLYMLSAAAFSAEGTQVYKSKDQSGNPLFTDRGTSKSEEITIEDPITFPAAVFKQDGNAFDYQNMESEADAEQVVLYEKLMISSPIDEQVIRQNAGSLRVEIFLPEIIAAQHQLNLLMDGATVAAFDGSPFDLQYIDRGVHTLQLQISDKESGEIIRSSPPVSFTMLRYSRPRKQPK